MKLDVEAANEALRSRIAAPLAKTVTEAAEGILRIAVTKMSYAVKGVTTERGLDAGNFRYCVWRRRSVTRYRGSTRAGYSHR